MGKVGIVLVLSLLVICSAHAEARMRMIYNGEEVERGHWAYPLCAALVHKGILDYPAEKFSGSPTLTDLEFADVTVSLFQEWRKRKAALPTEPVPPRGYSAEQSKTIEEARELHRAALLLVLEFGDHLVVTDVERQDTYYGPQVHATQMHKALGIEGIALADVAFLLPRLTESDIESVVPKDSWIYSRMRRLETAGLLEGYSAGYFDGSNDLTFYDIYHAIARALDHAAELDIEDDSLIALIEELNSFFDLVY